MPILTSERRNLLILMLCLVLAGVVFFEWIREPEYQGIALSQWIKGLEPAYPTLEFIQASNAVHEIGPAALPFLMEWIRFQPTNSTTKKTVAVWLQRLPPAVVPKFVIAWTDESLIPQRSAPAVTAFNMLGTKALPALPKLARLARESQNDTTVIRSLVAMYEMGPKALPIFLETIANPRAKGRFAAMFPLASFGTNALPAVPLLVRCLDDRDPQVAYGAATTLGQLQLDAQTCVPALMHTLGNTNPVLRAAAVKSLGQFNRAAIDAVPQLRQALEDKKDYVRRLAQAALENIESNVVTNTVTTRSGP